MDMVKVTGLLGRVTRSMMVIMMMMVMVVVIMIITGKGPVGTRDYDDNAAAININTDKFSKQGRDKGRSQTDHSNGCVHEGINCFSCVQN